MTLVMSTPSRVAGARASDVQAFGTRAAGAWGRLREGSLVRGRWCAAILMLCRRPPAGVLWILVVLRTEFCIFAGEVVNQIKLCVIFMVKSRIESNLCDWIESLCAVNVLWIRSDLYLWWNWTCIFVGVRFGASSGEVEAGGAGAGRSTSCWCQTPARGAFFLFFPDLL
jgi:hypothetical protein